MIDESVFTVLTGISDDLDDLVMQVLGEHELFDREDVGGVIADANAWNWSVSQYCVYAVQFHQLQGYRISVEFFGGGEQDEDKMFGFTDIHGTFTLVLLPNGDREIVDMKIDDPRPAEESDDSDIDDRWLDEIIDRFYEDPPGDAHVT